jgi:catechol 2,3-dioxygenase-like lactoylglutathione lyase family enzyme
MILEHVSITVSDLNRSLRFYCEVFGFGLLRKTTVNAYLYLDDQLLELIQGDPGMAAPIPHTDQEWHERKWRQVPAVHLGFRVDDIDDALSKIVALGGKVVGPCAEYTPTIEHVAQVGSEKLRRAAQPIGRSYWRIADVRDPDGVILEILER